MQPSISRLFRHEYSSNTYYIEIQQIYSYGYSIKLWVFYPQIECYQYRIRQKDMLRILLNKYTKINKGIQTQLATVNKSILQKVGKAFKQSCFNNNYSIIQGQGILKMYITETSCMQIYVSDYNSLPAKLQIEIVLSKSLQDRQKAMQLLVIKQLKLLHQNMQNRKQQKISNKLPKQQQSQQQQQQNINNTISKQQYSNKHKQLVDSIQQTLKNLQTNLLSSQQIQRRLLEYRKTLKKNRKQVKNKIYYQLQKRMHHYEIQQNPAFINNNKQHHKQYSKIRHKSPLNNHIVYDQSYNSYQNGRKRVNRQEIGDQFYRVPSRSLNNSDSQEQSLSKMRKPKKNQINYKSLRYTNQRKTNINTLKQKHRNHQYATTTLRFISNHFSEPSYFKYSANIITKSQQLQLQSDKGIIIDRQIVLEHDQRKIIKFKINKLSHQQKSAIYLGIIIKTYAVNYPTQDKVNMYSSTGQLHYEGKTLKQGEGFTQGDNIQLIVSKNQIQWHVNKKQAALLSKNIKRICTYYPIIVIRKKNDSVEFLGEQLQQ